MAQPPIPTTTTAHPPSSIEKPKLLHLLHSNFGTYTTDIAGVSQRLIDEERAATNCESEFLDSTEM